MLQPNKTYLEDTYGHYSPNEVKKLAINDHEKAALAQLQLRALGAIGVETAELLLWIDVYNTALGETDYS